MKLKQKYLQHGTLKSINYDWNNSRLTLKCKGIRPESEDVEDIEIIFHEVRKITIPHEKDYGNSDIITSFKRIEKSKWVFHMKSGDSFRVIANSCDW